MNTSVRKTFKKIVDSYNLKPEDILELVRHVADHAGAQGHTRYNILEHRESCPNCIELMARLFPKAGW